MLTFSAVTKRYADAEALRSVNLDVRPGEIFGLLGPNGAGKTTAAKLAVGLLRPTAGVVLLRGKDIHAGDSELDHLVGYVPDEPMLYPKLTGGEMLEFVAALRAISRERCRAVLDDFRGQFALDSDLFDRFTLTYSRGTKRKLALLLGLLHDPALLVLDEPTESLDASAVRGLRQLLVAKRAQGTAILLSTNDLASAELLCDRIGILSQGELVFTGSGETVRERHAQQTRKLEALFYEKVTRSPS